MPESDTTEPMTAPAAQRRRAAALLALGLCACGAVSVPPDEGQPGDASVEAGAGCSDGQRGGNETGVDCGGDACPPCGNGLGCRRDSDCQSGLCTGNVCRIQRVLSFAAPVDHAAGMPHTRAGFPTVQSLSAGDFDGDGAVDLAVPNTEGVAVTVLYGDGHGGFPTSLRIPTKGRPTHLAAGDFDGDGRADLVAGYDGTSLSFLRGRSGKIFDTPVDLRWPDGTFVVVAGDFDGDRRLDIAAGGKGGAAITVGAGDGHGGFTPRSAYPFTLDVNFLAAGDLDGDGRADLLLPESWQLCDVLLSKLDGTFRRSLLYQVDGATLDAPTMGDFDGDGHLDVALVVGNTDARVLRGDGTGQLAVASMLPLAAHGDDSATADFDGDGNLDLAVAGDTLGAVAVLLGDGHGHLVLGASLVVTGLALGLAVADFDGDGLPDIAAAQDLIGAGDPMGGVRLFLNTSR